MSVCCEANLGICHTCKQETVVHIDRDTASERGFGCTNCGTATAYQFTCKMGVEKDKVVAECGKEFIRYYASEPDKNKTDSRYCDEHHLYYLEHMEITKTVQVEFVPQHIKDERPKYLKSMIQSHRQGELSKEFVELYPQKVKQMVDAGKITKEEVRKAKNVWGDLPNIHNVKKTL